MEIKIEKYNDVWLDNGLTTFYQLLEDIKDDSDCLERLEVNANEVIYSFEDKEKFIEELTDTIKGKIRNMVVKVEDKETGERKEVKKDHILIQEGKKLRGKVAFKENIFYETLTEQTIKEVIDNLEGDKLKCFFCNRKFQKNLKKLQQASYPFVTKIKSLSGIRSGINYKLTEYVSEYCPQCYLNGILEWLDETMVYRTIPREKSILILPNTTSLSDLIKLKKSYNNILENQARWSNIKVDLNRSDVENTPGRFTTFISFYENFLREVAQEIENVDWYIIEIPQSGSVKNPKYFNIHLEVEIIRILDTLIRQEKFHVYRTFVKQFYAFHTDAKKGIRDFDREKVLHEQLCESLVKNNFDLFASTFVPRKGIRPGMPKECFETLDKLIFNWRIEPMQIENKEEYLKTVGAAGSTLAKLIGRRLSLFFKLEKSKNPNQFLEALQEITRRVVIDDTDELGKLYLPSIEKVSQMILEKYDQEDGKEFFNTTKNILLIYISLRSKKSQATQSKNKEEQNES